MVRIVKEADERRQELITYAQQLFFTKGYERTSVNDIVRAVGIAKGTFYHYFESKSALLEALVFELVKQQLAVLQQIVAEEQLTAIEKWRKAFQVIGNWKVERKAELLDILEAMYKEENILFGHKIRAQSMHLVAPEITNIIQQGIDEGVFDTPFAQESATIAMSILSTFSDTFSDMMLHPEQYDNFSVLMERKVLATQTAVERVLGAPHGSLPIIDTHSLAQWLAVQPTEGDT